MPSLGIKTDEWMRELERISAPKSADDEGGMTFREIWAKVKLGEDKLRDRLRELQADGRLKVVRKDHIAIDGTRRKVAAYIILPAAKKK